MPRPTSRIDKLGAAVALVLALGVVGGPLLANGDEEDSGTVLLVFGCYVSLPAGFVVNTRETEYTSLFLRPGSRFLRLTVSAYRGPLGDDLEYVGSSRTAGLTVEEYRFKGRPEDDDPSRRVVRLHDENQEMMIYGATDALVSRVTRSCERDKAPGLVR